MKILGISAFYHDSAATLVVDGNIVAAAQEERFTRVKHDASFPLNAIKFCLEESNSLPSQVDTLVFYDKPLLKFERLLESYYAFAPRGLFSFVTAIPVWLNEKLFFKRLIKKKLKEIGFEKIPKLIFPEHHLSHAASAFYPSPYEESAILTIDGVGEWATASIGYGKGNSIEILKELRYPHSLGLLYSAFTYFLGFRVNSGEYKLMGLAPYGNRDDEEVKKFEQIIKETLIDLKQDGSIWLNQSYFNYATGLKMVFEKKWGKLFGIPKRKVEDELSHRHCNLAMAIQNVTEEVVYLMAKEAKRLTKSKNLCLSGGVALNCVSNGKLQNSKLFQNLFIQPAAGDAGGSLGAAMAAHFIYHNNDRTADSSKPDAMNGTYLGPEILERDLQKVINTHQVRFIKLDYPKLYKAVAEYLDQGKVIGWVQGKMEFGPRALGNRSILGDPRNPEMQRRLNLKIKNRESFRPFAPSVLADEVSDYFQLETDSPYMLLVQQLAEKYKNELPAEYPKWKLKDKLSFVKSAFPAITHVDYSARIQTVHKATNLHYWNLIHAFKEQTGCAMLVNTSFNVRGEPMVGSADDAYQCFMRTDMDVLVIGSYLFIKEDQPEWERDDHLKKKIVD